MLMGGSSLPHMTSAAPAILVEPRFIAASRDARHTVRVDDRNSIRLKFLQAPRLRDTRPHMEDHAPDREQALLARARGGDAAAFEALIIEHYPYIFRVAYRWLAHESDAEDVTQTVCMRLPEAIRSFDGRAAFTSWLYRVTLNAVRDLQRSRQRQGRLADAVAVLAEDCRPPEQEDALHVADIWRAVRALPEKQRDAVMLVHAEGLSQAEAARIMGCKEVTVAWHIHRARKTLRGVL